MKSLPSWSRFASRWARALVPFAALAGCSLDVPAFEGADAGSELGLAGAAPGAGGAAGAVGAGGAAGAVGTAPCGWAGDTSGPCPVDAGGCDPDAGGCGLETEACSDGAGDCDGGVGPDANASGDKDGGCAADGVGEGCECVAGAAESCGACGQRTCEPSTGRWGACTGDNRPQSCWETQSGSALPGVAPDEPLGNCRLGQQRCGSSGEWTACEGAVAPAAADSCDVPADDANCDGVVNEGCACVKDADRACGSDVGSCSKGTQTCGADGQWGGCVGEVRAAPSDACEVAGDDANCNGTANDGCECTADAPQGCDDQLSCTDDLCLAGACANPPKAGFCLIGDQCYGGGAVNPNNACEVCAPGVSAVAWSPNDGQACDDGLFCTTDAQCDGNSCVALGARLCPSNQQCSEPERACVCEGCLIGAGCVAAGTVDPNNPCRGCQPSVSADTYSPNSGASCGASADECSAQDTCDANGVCQANDLAEGTGCSGGVCEAGHCNPFDCIAPDPPVVTPPDDKFMPLGSPPAPTGGTILDGRYVPTRVDTYGPEPGTYALMTFEFHDGFVQVGFQPWTQTFGIIGEIQFAGSFETSGATLSFTVDRCDPQYNTDVPTLKYSTTANGLITHEDHGGGNTTVVSYVRQ